MSENNEEAQNSDMEQGQEQPSLEELQAVLGELGLSPAQIKGRLEASRKWEDRAKEKSPFIEELKAKAKRLEEIENANKTELEKERERAAAAEAQLNTFRLEADRNSVALAKGLTPTQAKRLVGSTREELEADADELLADLKASRPASTPSADGQGRVGEALGRTNQITSRDQLKSMKPAQIAELRRSGALDALMGINS